MAAWAGGTIATKIAVGQLDPVLVGMLRTCLGAAGAAALVLAMGIPLPRTRPELWLLFVSGFGCFVLFPVLFSMGMRGTTASHAALIFA
ncbi:MAG: EamA family transporter, partial [bacterium]